ncbi:hypothetical protein PABG_02895 [Paracoccidioides brasiliensis Pb03]|nr:hypothetical protein PABG_02895 [Paracoccidioides brasiliensis Pb03]
MYGLFTLASPPAIVRVDGEDFTLKHPDNYKDLGEDERRNIEKEIKKTRGLSSGSPTSSFSQRKRWGFLGIEEPIPHKFSDEELNAQTDGAAKFNELQDFWDMISNLVDRCRWSSNSTYPQAVELLEEMDRESIKSKVTDESIRADFQKWIDREEEQHHHS